MTNIEERRYKAGYYEKNSGAAIRDGFPECELDHRACVAIQPPEPTSLA